MAKKDELLVHCRYPKCKFLHETKELNKGDAIEGGSKGWYYHPDCYHTMRTINQIRDEFYTYVNSSLTGPQIGQLVSIVNNMVFAKHIDVEYILFALRYYIKNKPGSLKYPGGIAYIVQNRDVESAWKKQQDAIVLDQIRDAMKKQEDEIIKEECIDFGLNNDDLIYKQNNISY